MSLAPHIIEVAQILAEGILRSHLIEHRRLNRRRTEKDLDLSREWSGHAANESRYGETT